MSEDREDFGVRQAEMTARWYANIKATYGDVDAYIATRHTAYMDRWREAGRFIPDGARVLDIGGGNLFAELLRYFKRREFRYAYLDVDPDAVEGSRKLASGMGLEHFTFGHGFNDSLPFADETFDAVFSSHCIEHSIDLLASLREVNRVLPVGGNFLMAVPFGWELNPEHPYFLGPLEWIALLQDSGFRVRIAQIGNEYPEFGEDYFVACEKVGPVDVAQRILPGDYMKDNYNMVGFDDPSVERIGEFEIKPDYVIATTADSRLTITPPAAATQVLPILHRHSWSGTIRMRSASRHIDCDLFSWFAYDMPQQFALDPVAHAPIELALIGKAPVSRWSQFVFKGYLWR